jgi:hypothetical protein
MHARHFPAHQWLGLTMIAGVAVHTALHWDWLWQLFASRGTWRAGLDRFIDIVLIILVLALLVSGLMIGGLLGDELARVEPWQPIHHATSKLLILIAGWHVLRHWRWLWRALQRVWRPREPVGPPVSLLFLRILRFPHTAEANRHVAVRSPTERRLPSL